MILMIFVAILIAAAFVGIGFIPKRVTFVMPSDGWYDTRSREFIEKTEENENTYHRGYEDVTEGQSHTYTKGGYSSKPLQLVSFVLVFLLLFGMIKTVGANRVGIEYDPFNGGVQDITLEEGIHFRMPWVKVYNINTVQQELSFEEFSVQTNGSEFAWFIPEVKYKVNRTNAFEVFRNFQGLPSSSMIRQDVQDAIKTVAESYNIYDILGGEYAELKSEAEALLVAKLAVYGIDLITLNFIDIDAGLQIEAKITERGLAQQQQAIEQQLFEAAQIAQQKEQVEAETARIRREEAADADLYEQQKEADAEAYQIEAQARADAIKIEVAADADLYSAVQEALGIIALGEADAEAYAVVIAAFGSIEAYNTYIHYTQWNGSVPEIVMGESGLVPIWEMGDVIEGATE